MIYIFISQDGTFQVPRAIWTVLVDRIDLTPAFRSVANNKDIYLRGHVTWVGKSSMEATIEVTQQDESGTEAKLLGGYHSFSYSSP